MRCDFLVRLMSPTDSNAMLRRNSNK